MWTSTGGSALNLCNHWSLGREEKGLWYPCKAIHAGWNAQYHPAGWWNRIRAGQWGGTCKESWHNSKWRFQHSSATFPGLTVASRNLHTGVSYHLSSCRFPSQKSCLSLFKVKSPSKTNSEKRFIFTVQFSCSVVSDSLQPHGLQHSRPPCPSPTPGVYSNSCPSSQWIHPTISSSVVPFSSCLQSFPASGSFPISQFFAWSGQNIRVSASASVLPMNTQDWSPLGHTAWISLQSKGLSRVFSNTTVEKH